MILTYLCKVTLILRCPQNLICKKKKSELFPFLANNFRKWKLNALSWLMVNKCNVLNILTKGQLSNRFGMLVSTSLK